MRFREYKIEPKHSAIECGDITRAIFEELGIEIKIVPIRY